VELIWEKAMSSTPIAQVTSAPRSSETFRVIAAASIGNALEWYDILIYGYFAVTISRLFFPTADQTVSLLLALGTFGVSYLVRPLGAIVLGAYTDRAGRKAAMLVSIVFMTIGTGLMAILPTYASIGVLAPIAVLIARLLQGFAVAGEFGSATAFLVEQSTGRKGLFASFQWFGQGLAAALASFFGVVLTSVLTSSQLESWGWRVPFFFGLLVGPIGPAGT
jgi:MFS transporter, MHS family, proline/betaine transporter